MAGAYGIGSHAAVNLQEVDDGLFGYNDKVVVETSQREGQDVEIRPIGGVVNQAGPFTFVIDPIDKYIQLNNAGLEIVMRVVKKDGSLCHSHQDLVAPVNLVGIMMWDTIDVHVNGQPFEGAANINTGYKGYIETVLSFDTDARNTHMNAQFFHLDSPHKYGTMAVSLDTLKLCFIKGLASGAILPPPIPAACAMEVYGEGDPLPDVMPTQGEEAIRGAQVTNEQIADETNGSSKWKQLMRNKIYQQYFLTTMGGEEKINAIAKSDVKDLNIGFETRFQLTCDSSPFDTFVPITHDMFRLSNHLAPGNRVTVKFTRASDDFLLNTYLPEDYKLEILDMKMHLHTIDRRPSKESSADRFPMLKEVYQLTQTEMHKQVLAQDVTTAQFRIQDGGVMPKSIVFAMTETRAADGNKDYNPLYFRHFFLKKLTLKINGERYPAEGFKWDWTPHVPLVSRGYHTIFENTGSAGGERGNCVSWEAYRAGMFLVCVDLTPDKCNGLHNHNAVMGSIDVELIFAYPLPTPIYVLYEKVFPKLMLNDRGSGALNFLHIET